MSAGPAVRPAGDAAMLVAFGTAIDDAVFARVLALDAALSADPPPGVVETVPAYASLLVHYDPLRTRPDELQRALLDAAAQARPQPLTGREHRVPVCHAPEFAPDLPAVAEQAGLTERQVIAAHGAADYRVYMYGFAPGYAYLGGVPRALRLPRKPEPVRGVPAGAVMIAGAQALVTTLTMPSGWWVIGRSPARLLDLAAQRPSPFDPGDRVRFVAVDRAEFDRLAAA
ncbi:MAG: allophanate hydrolase subunit 1 [Sphingomonadaceae bacterium]|nr:allophanate hydrolase subunit 1 [Sphingomonadaceae bacterium]